MRYQFAVILILSLIPTLGDAAEKKVRIATLPDYAPFCMVEETYEVNQTIAVGHDAIGFKGYSWDVVRESFQEMGYTIQLSITPWARAMHDVKSGVVDILFPTGKNTERERFFFHYSEETVNEANFVVYVRADSAIAWEGLDSLKGLTIGVKRGFNYGDRWETTTHINKYDVATISQGFDMLTIGRIDGFLGYEYNWDYYLKQAHLRGLFKKLPAFGSTAEYVVVLKNNPRGKELLKAFDEGKKRLIEDGRLNEIKRRWFGQTLPPATHAPKNGTPRPSANGS